MRRYRAGILAIAALFGLAVLAGLVVARRFGPDHVLIEVERPSGGPAGLARLVSAGPGR